MIIALAVPFFFLLVALELWLARRQGRVVHGYADSLADLYWYHRFSHRVNFAWATHVVHHQSEEYNLIVALRQSWFTNLYGFVFYLPLALIGVTATQVAVSSALSLLYQFWIHTRLIDRMGWFERWFNTPSHHRVHHGRDAQYLDSNYAATLIIWDKMFGTFVPEVEEPHYGIVQRFRSYDPLWANVEPFLTLWRRAKVMPTLKDALWLWFAPPEWHPASEAKPNPGDPPPAFETARLGLRAYAFAVFVSAVGLTMWMLVASTTLPTAALMALAVASVWSLAAVAAVVEERPEAWRLEGARLLTLTAVGLGGLGFTNDSTALGLVFLGLGLPLVPFFFTLRASESSQGVTA